MADDKAKTPEAASKEAAPLPPDSATTKTTVPPDRNTEKQMNVPASGLGGISKASSLTDMVQQVKAAQEKQNVAASTAKEKADATTYKEEKIDPAKKNDRQPEVSGAEKSVAKSKIIQLDKKEPVQQKNSPAKEMKTSKATTKQEKTPKPSAPKKAASKDSDKTTPPTQEQAKSPEPPKEAPRRGKEQIVYIKLNELHAFKNHPFQVRDDEEMRAMVSSVKDKGVTQPAIVRPREDGGYEIVSGHRRQKASELAGYTDMPCIVRNLTDDEAITQMVEDNLNQREEILPSERAKALKMQLEAIKHQGSRTSGQIDPKDVGKRSNEIVAERNKMAVKQVQRYIRLNELVPDLMKLTDEKKLGFTTAVELSYISKRNQNYIAVAIDSQQSSPSQAQAKRMRELDEKKLLNGDVIDGIMMEDKKEVDKVILTGAELSKYFGRDATPREMKEQIIKLLDDWKGQQKEHEKLEKKTEKEK